LILGGLCGVAVIVIAAIVLSVVLISGSKDESSSDTQEKLKLEDILLGKLQPKRFGGTWIDDSSFQFQEDVSYRNEP
jgi:hypothetical protein